MKMAHVSFVTGVSRLNSQALRRRECWETDGRLSPARSLIMHKSIYVVLITIPIIMHCATTTTCVDRKVIRKRVSKDLCYPMIPKPPKFDNFLWCRVYSWKQWKRRKRCSVYGTAIASRERRRAIEFDKEVHRDILHNASMARVVTGPFPTSSLALMTRFKHEWPVGLWRQYGLFTDEYLFVINSYWLHFPPPHPAAHYALGLLYFLIMAIGCTGNSLVLLMYYRCRSLRTPGNILVANLALSDFLMLAKTPVFIFNSFNLGPALGKTGCLIYGFVGGLTGVTSIATLAAIALDRYWAVVQPLQGLRALTGLRARLFAVAAWVYGAAFALVPALDIGYGHYAPEGYLTSCSFDYLTDEMPPRYFIFIFFCAAWLAPFCTITFCYVNIFRVVAFNRNVTSKDQENRLSSRHVKEQVKRKAEIKLAFLVIVVIALFFVSWTPYAIVALLGIFGRKDLITPLSSMAPALFCKTAACINPFIYLITHPKFRKEFHKLFIGNTKSGNGTLKTIGYYTEGNRVRMPSKDLSDTDVEVVQMKNIPYQQGYDAEEVAGGVEGRVQTVSSQVAEQEGSQRSTSITSLQDSVVAPPSWYSKPQFTKKRSFHRRSSKSLASNTDII